MHAVRTGPACGPVAGWRAWPLARRRPVPGLGRWMRPDRRRTSYRMGVGRGSRRGPCVRHPRWPGRPRCGQRPGPGAQPVPAALPGTAARRETAVQPGTAARPERRSNRARGPPRVAAAVESTPRATRPPRDPTSAAVGGAGAVAAGRPQRWLPRAARRHRPASTDYRPSRRTSRRPNFSGQARPTRGVDCRTGGPSSPPTVARPNKCQAQTSAPPKPSPKRVQTPSGQPRVHRAISGPARPLDTRRSSQRHADLLYPGLCGHRR